MSTQIGDQRPTFMTVRLGTHKSLDALRQALLDKGFKISSINVDVIREIKIATKPVEVELVHITEAELGFPNGTSQERVYEKALSLGFKLCSAEVGPQLRLQLPDQPEGDWLRVAIESIAGHDDLLASFIVGHGHGGQSLTGECVSPEHPCYGNGQWIFCK